jgi:aryl-alcohol dehydrogenase-like predicted oxidoreductase
VPVAPVGISGHYGLPVEGFVRAIESGVNVLFWEPNYQTLTSFASRLGASQRRELNFLAGTFEATPARVRKDVERALRFLQIEQLTLFLLFWTRGWDRITDELRGELEALQAERKISMLGLSTHSRPLALEALAGDWGVVMVRHSAAHRGAEDEIFPRASAQGTSVITFNNTCYGRLLEPIGDRPGPAPSDCYRFTLMQPGVSLCLSAPSTLDELDENLRALHDPELPELRLKRLLDHGRDLYREESRFRRLVRDR